ncbi:phosphopantetheine-binding protein [Paractinoplanes atraurantiacus]|uniref:Polyketide biosynthesis acyl carrier protein n=1 Tax=Paractinoplanes atraurantiacus TaxID=1036182 RepID=A0A285GLL4_9ACTN|nr:phosphopantetheine-binding protein [Actinoplanes atraurantiacus]SNY24459.1 polyketide biosynthesis acyl carrier protein [Actinoplanes atraurantiacus]
MDDTEVFAAVRAGIAEVLPEVRPDEVDIDGTLTDLGANSIDRAEIVTLAMQRLGVTVPVAEFRDVHDLRSLVDLLAKHA